MAERGGKGVASQPPATLLNSLIQFPRGDITNPRDLYSLLSESRSHDNIFAALNPQAGARLPPLQAETAEMQLRALQRGKAHHGSYPDLLRFHRDENGDFQQLPPVRRSSSLQDIDRMNDRDTRLSIKKLKPILRQKGPNHRNMLDGGHGVQQQQKQVQGEKGGVKFGHKEVRLIKDSPLPPIEGKGVSGASPFPSGKREADPNADSGVPAEKSQTQTGLGSQGLSSIHEQHVQVGKGNGHKRAGPDWSPEIFPRGLPVEVKKPVTPAYEDYPEAYWELRSPTVQDPSDLKEDMIDRDRYRLLQISSLRLKAVPRELAVNKLDSYRKWQQQMQETTPTPRGVTATPSAAAPSNGPAASTANGAVQKSAKESGKPQKLSVPIQTQTLSVAATSISPSVHPRPNAKKRNASSMANHVNRTQDGVDSINHLAEEELRQREKLKAGAMSVGDQSQGVKAAAKPVKPAVVNLGVENPDLLSTGIPTSDLYAGVRRVVMTTRPHSDQTYSLKQGQGVVRKHPGSALSSVTGSNCATVGSMYRVPTTPTATPPINQANGAATVSNGNDKTGKKILKKFNRLQVFGEKTAAVDGHAENDDGEDVLSTPPEKALYLPQNRPPTYKLDMRNYPPRRSGSASREWGEHELGGYPVLASDSRGVPMIQSPVKSEAPSLNFKLRNGEVIVSRQGKRPLAV